MTDAPEYLRARDIARLAPEEDWIDPGGVLQHESPQVNERYYNLARSMQAGQRFGKYLADARNRLRPLSIKPPRNAVLYEQRYSTIRQRDRGEPPCA
jgi:hypothetical protein